ncbi:MAG: nuclear transport factor 2 family protein [Pseudomonadota bacterium]
MTQEESNVAILKGAYDAWHETKGDSNVWMDILADEIAFGSAADGRPGLDFTKARASKQEVAEYFEGLKQDWEMEFYHINEFVAQGERVVALAEVSWINRQTGKPLRMPKADVWMLKDGKVTQFMEFYDSQPAIEATQN